MFIYSLLTALLCIPVTCISWPLRGLFLSNTPLAETSLTYLTFLGWATYFLFGAAPKPAAKAYASMFLGILGAILMYVASYWSIWPVFSFDPTFSFPVAMGVVVAVFFMCYIVYIPWAGNVAASFVAAASFFSLIACGVFPNGAATTAVEYAMAGIAVMFYILLGFIAGWVTIQIDTFARGIGVKKD